MLFFSPASALALALACALTVTVQLYCANVMFN